MSNNLPASYKEAADELQEIVDLLKDSQVDVDVLTDKVKRACQLVIFCKERLRMADSEIEAALKMIDDVEKNTPIAPVEAVSDLEPF